MHPSPYRFLTWMEIWTEWKKSDRRLREFIVLYTILLMIISFGVGLFAGMISMAR